MCVDDNNNGVPVRVPKTKPVLPSPSPSPLPPTQPRPDGKIQRFRQPEWTHFRTNGDNFPEEDQRIGYRHSIASFLFRRSSRFVWQIPWSAGELIIVNSSGEFKWISINLGLICTDEWRALAGIYRTKRKRLRMLGLAQLWPFIGFIHSSANNIHTHYPPLNHLLNT